MNLPFGRFHFHLFRHNFLNNRRNIPLRFAVVVHTLAQTPEHLIKRRIQFFRCRRVSRGRGQKDEITTA